MNKFLTIIERYQYGIIAAIAVHIGIFIYLEMNSYRNYFDVTPFYEEEQVIIEPEQLELTPENVMIDRNIESGEIKNVVRDKKDNREKSMESWSQNEARQSDQNVEQSVRQYATNLFDQAGGNAERQRILKEMEQRKKQQFLQQNKSDQSKTPVSGVDKMYGGNVMVEWSLSNRTPHQNNNWFVRNPGYTCGYGASGKVTVQIKVNQNGDVVSAIPIENVAASTCMIEQAVKYAKLSRFNYTSSESKFQSGTITYMFISQ